MAIASSRSVISKYVVPLGVFSVACVAFLLLEYLFHLTDQPRTFYFVDHYLFGIGFPFAWVPIFSPEGKEPYGWLAPVANKLKWFVDLLGDGFGLGVTVSEIWSFWNELLVYWIRNPSHGADWGHWFADLAGLASAYLIYSSLVRVRVATASV